VNKEHPLEEVGVSELIRGKKEVRIEAMDMDMDMDMERVDQIIDKHKCEASSLVQVLLAIQTENHWLPKEALERVAERLQVPLTRIQQVATFYKAFSLVPKGRHTINVCTGTACYARGASRVLEMMQDLTGLKSGETDLDLKFSLEKVSCPGCCALGPYVEIDGETQELTTPAAMADVLKKFE